METKIIVCPDENVGYIIKGDGFTFTVMMDDDNVIFTYGIMDDRNHYQRSLRALKLKFKDYKLYNVEMDKDIRQTLRKIARKDMSTASANTLNLALDLIDMDDDEDEFEVQTIL